MQGSFTYIIKVSAIGGEKYWSNEKTFVTECGPNSVQISASSDSDLIV